MASPNFPGSISKARCSAAATRINIDYRGVPITCPRNLNRKPKPPSPTGLNRCHWAAKEWNIPYHDQEWGVPIHDDRLLFEFLILEGAQAGLSWDTILAKRARYKEVFDDF